MNSRIRELAVIVAGIGVFAAASSGTTAMMTAQGALTQTQTAQIAGSVNSNTGASTTSNQSRTGTAAKNPAIAKAAAAAAPSFGTSSHATQKGGSSGNSSGEAEGDD
jgi:hypothetical protein